MRHHARYWGYTNEEIGTDLQGLSVQQKIQSWKPKKTDKEKCRPCYESARNNVIGEHRGENTKLTWSFQTVPKDCTCIRLVNGDFPGHWGHAHQSLKDSTYLNHVQNSIYSDVHFLLQMYRSSCISFESHLFPFCCLSSGVYEAQPRLIHIFVGCQLLSVFRVTVIRIKSTAWCGFWKFFK